MLNVLEDGAEHLFFRQLERHICVLVCAHVQNRVHIEVQIVISGLARKCCDVAVVVTVLCVIVGLIWPESCIETT